MTDRSKDERPIVMRDWEVRAILAGQKTMMRRVVRIPPRKLCPVSAQFSSVKNGVAMFICGTDGALVRCQLGQPGDRLWVRKTWNARPVSEVDSGMYEAWAPYKAIPKQQPSNAWVYFEADGDEEGPWRPSIHMPRWASRLTLEITSVRVERLQEISDEDAFAEGTPCYVCGRPMDGFSESDCHCFHRKARASDYQMLWESIHGPGSWAANPWVWVIDFRRVTP